MTIAAAGDLNNIAEIIGSTAVDANGEPFLDPSGAPLVDIDSIADAVNSDVLSDGVLNGDGGDEDDHDIASISVLAAVAEAPVLAFTGRSSVQIAFVSIMILLAGLAMVAFARRKEDEELIG